MRKGLSVLVAALLVVALSIGVFASTYPLENEPTFSEKDGDTYIGTLVTSSLTNAQKDFLRAWLKSDTNMLCYSRNSSLAHGQIVFYIFSSDTVLTSANVSTSDSNWGTMQFQSGAQYSSLSFDAVTGKQVGDGTYCNTSGTSRSVSSNTIGVGTFISGTIFKKFSNVSLPSSALLDFDGRLYIVDDDGLLQEDEPPESSSEPEIPSSNGGSIHIPAPSPDFPSGETAYLPYDVSVFEDLTLYLRQAIGSAGDIILRIVFIMIAISTVFAVIRHYMNQSKSGGGDSGGLI